MNSDDHSGMEQHIATCTKVIKIFTICYLRLQGMDTAARNSG